MASITTRVGKGSPLTTQELDANFTNLNTDKVEKSGADPVVISVNSASDALRITQTGAGNALVVEDSANPDSTPFVVDASGNTFIGYTTSTAPSAVSGADLQVNSLGSTQGNLNLAQWSAVGSGSAQLLFSRSLSGVRGTQTAVTSGTAIGKARFFGSDGTNLIEAANIEAYADGTPGTNDMPGRLIFSTTADGASSSTERMRIDSAGRVGIGTISLANSMLRSSGNVTGAVTMRGIQQSGIVQSDVTTASYCFTTTNVGTQATAFTLPILTHFYADQGTIGAGSTVTNQYGFFSNSTLTGATNDFGFYSNIASGTGRWNFYAAGTADNYFAGSVGIGSTPITYSSSLSLTPILQTNRNGATSAGISRFSANSSSNSFWFLKSRGAAVGSFDVVASGDSLGAIGWLGADGADGVRAASIEAVVDGTPGTNDMPGRLIFSTTADGSSTPTERMRIDSVGSVGIGGAAISDRKIDILGNSAGATVTARSILARPTITSNVTSSYIGFYSLPAHQAAAFTNSAVEHFRAGQTALSGGAAITTQIGFHAGLDLTGATNNYGFYSNIASGTGRYNFYAAGTAENYFAGAVTIVGALTVTDPVVQQSDISTAPNEVPLNQFLGELAFQNEDQFVIRPPASVTPNGIGDMTFQLTNNTTLVVKVKGSDGTVRSATLTLA